MRLLLCEDYHAFAEIALDALRGAGHKVSSVARNGHAAMDLVRAEDWDAVVTDYDLGWGPNGGQVAQAALHAGAPLVVLWSSIPRRKDELPDEKMAEALAFHMLEKSDIKRVVALLDELEGTL